jgi:hypothetical protein
MLRYLLVMFSSVKKSGYINGIRFEIKDTNTIRIWKPSDIAFFDFKSRCDLTVKYLIDEGFFNKTKCKVEVVT